jgi:hypothetical protein
MEAFNKTVHEMDELSVRPIVWQTKVAQCTNKPFNGMQLVNGPPKEIPRKRVKRL